VSSEISLKDQSRRVSNVWLGALLVLNHVGSAQKMIVLWRPPIGQWRGSDISFASALGV
jgi:hypothetical protein